MSSPVTMYRDYRTDGCPSDSCHLIGDDMAELLDRGLPYDQLERPAYANAADRGACRLSFTLSLDQAMRMGYSACEYEDLFARNGISGNQARADLAALGLDKIAIAAIRGGRAARPPIG
jgi:hypothetical protein